MMNLRQDVPFTLLGHVTKGRISVDGESIGDINDFKGLYNNSLGELLDK